MTTKKNASTPRKGKGVISEKNTVSKVVETTATTELQDTDADVPATNGEEVKGVILSTIPTVVLGGCGASSLQIEIARLAWEKNFSEAQVVIVGVDIPLTLSGDDPVANHTEMIVAALSSDLVPMRFVFAPIETFPVAPLRMADLEVLKAWDATSHKEEMQTIAKVMGLETVPSYYYPTLLPMVLGKEYVAEIIEEYKLDTNIVNINTVYMAHYFPNLVPFIADVNSTVLAVVTRANPNMDVVAKVLPKRMFFHCNGDGLSAIAELLTERLG